MNGFVNRLLVQLLQSYPFPISMAVPGGLIINELPPNALKRAFVDRKESTIEVSLTAPEFYRGSVAWKLRGHQQRRDNL